MPVHPSTSWLSPCSKSPVLRSPSEHLRIGSHRNLHPHHVTSCSGWLDRCSNRSWSARSLAPRLRAEIPALLSEVTAVMRLLAGVLVALLTAPMASRADTSESTRGKPVLVTGASSGIGLKITERLAADGYFVYATARKDADLKALGAIKNVQPVHLDVTQPADIAAAVKAVTQAGRGLYGLVNNAGVATFGTIADMRIE